MRNRKYYYFVFIYILIILIVVEIFIRLMFGSQTISKQLWVNESMSWRRSWVERKKETGKEIYYNFDVYDSTKGWVTQSNITDMQVFDNKILNTNSIGIRGKGEYNFGKDSTKVRFFTLGDSFTFGEEVSDDETYPYYLQYLLPGSEVINLGVHGYGHDQMLISLKEHGLKYNTDFVILGFIEADAKRNMVNFRDFAKPQFKFINKMLTLTSVPVPNPESILKWDWIRPRIIDISLILKHQIDNKSGKYDLDKNKITSAILSEVIKECKNQNTTPIFVYIPLISEVHTSTYMVPGEKYLYDFCNEQDVLFLTTRPYLMNKNKKGIIYKDAGHWGPQGNRAIAEAINLYLRENNLLK